MDTLRGFIIECGYRLEEDKNKILFFLEIKDENRWYCTLLFSDENTKKVFEMFSQKNEKELIGEKLYLREHPKRGTVAPIGISKDKKKWIYKIGFDQHDK